MAVKSPQFYESFLSLCLNKSLFSREDSVLVICGGERDRQAFELLGMGDVTISNLDERHQAKQFAPYEWSFQDAENLDFEDASFDVVVVHAGLHHCYSPHKAILEMYRVAQKALVLVEPCDSWFTRAGVLLGIGQEYEHAAVYFNDCKYGGVKNRPIPNYISRFTSREIKNTINCAHPEKPHRFLVRTRFLVPVTQLQGRRHWIFRIIVILAKLVEKIATRFLSNQIAVAIAKPGSDEFHPWFYKDEEGLLQLNERWLDAKYQR